MSLGTVVVVGGIGGHSLSVGPAGWPWPQAPVWLNSAALLAGGWLWLGLAEDGQSPSSKLFPPLEPGNLLPDYYGVLATELGAHGWNVVGPQLDWRGPIARDGQRLASLVLDLASAGPVRIVAHSRGGLVARSAIRLLEQAGRLSAVSDVVGLGVPHLGSLAAAQMLAGWQVTILLVLRLLRLRHFLLPTPPPPSWFQNVVVSWPSVYELLPRPGAPWLPPDQSAALYDAYTYHGAPAAIDQRLLDAAQTWWNAAPSVPSAVRWFDVVGYGIDTPDRLTSAPVSSPGSMALSASGDGLVVEASAHHPGRLQVRAPVAHGALPYDGRVMEAVHAALSGQLTADVTLS